MKIGDIIEIERYTEAALWCRDNKSTLKEIEPIIKDVEETYYEDVEVIDTIPAVTHEEEIDGETVIITDEPERKESHTEKQEKVHTVKKVIRRYEIIAIEEKKPTDEEIRQMRENAYTQEVDPITAHISRLRDSEQTEEVKAEIAELIAERDIKVQEIKERYPYNE